MPDTNRPGRLAPITDHQQAQKARVNQANQQLFVWTDSTKATGDPAHNFARIVIGDLRSICGIPATGIASYGFVTPGVWTQIA